MPLSTNPILHRMSEPEFPFSIIRGTIYHDPTSSGGTVSAISAKPAVYIKLAENPWKVRAMTRSHGARAKHEIRVAAKARPKPVKRGPRRDELRSANQPAIAASMSDWLKERPGEWDHIRAPMAMVAPNVINKIEHQNCTIHMSQGVVWRKHYIPWSSDTPDLSIREYGRTGTTWFDILSYSLASPSKVEFRP